MRFPPRIKATSPSSCLPCDITQDKGRHIEAQFTLAPQWRHAETEVCSQQAPALFHPSRLLLEEERAESFLQQVLRPLLLLTEVTLQFLLSMGCWRTKQIKLPSMHPPHLISKLHLGHVPLLSLLGSNGHGLVASLENITPYNAFVPLTSIDTEISIFILLCGKSCS